MERNIRHYVQAARKSIAYATPRSAVVLEALAVLTEEDIQWLLTHDNLEESRMKRISIELGQHFRKVQDAIGDFLRLDLKGHSASNETIEAGHSSRYSEADIGKSLLSYSGGQASVVHFVLRGLHYTWNPDLGRLLIQRIEDDELADACKGYLISRGMVFESVIDLLDTARQEEWKNWDTLWKYF